MTIAPAPTPARAAAPERARRHPAPWAAALAALTSLGLGALAALLLVATDHPWEGPVVRTIIAGHGIHRGDLLAAVPVVASTALAAWCWRRRA